MNMSLKFYREKFPKCDPLSEVEFEDLPKYPNMIITACGEENIYFTHEGKKYFCKCL